MGKKLHTLNVTMYDINDKDRSHDITRTFKLTDEQLQAGIRHAEQRKEWEKKFHSDEYRRNLEKRCEAEISNIVSDDPVSKDKVLIFNLFVGGLSYG